MPILKTMLQAEPQLLLFIGDNIYADTLDSAVMRGKYERLAANEDFRKLRGSCPTLATWDDHDYGVNDGGAEHPNARRRSRPSWISGRFRRFPPAKPSRCLSS